jgi:cytochrome c oxidase subunit 2
MKSFKYTLHLVTVLALVIVLAACGGNNNADQPAEQAPATATGEVQEVVINATNWEFSPNVIEVKKGTTVKLTLENTDGFHGIAIPELGIEVKGGETVEFVAGEAGEFKFMCSVLCGTGHAQMTGELVVTE